MPIDDFEQLAKEFRELARKLKNCADPAERKRILSKMRSTIKELDRLTSERQPE